MAQHQGPPRISGARQDRLETVHQKGSHVKLRHSNFLHPFEWSFHDGEELGPRMLSRIAKKTGLTPDDL
jgi:predicted RNA binding protein YcfA (HicA-like mRNA interferase family)